MQKRSKVGKDNPQYGVKKSRKRIKKLIKLVYVYNNEDMSYIGCYLTVQCSKGKPCTTCTYRPLYRVRYDLLNGLPFKHV